MKIFLVVTYSRGNDELAELADTLVTATQLDGHTPFVGWREIRNRHLSAGREWMPFLKTLLSTCDLLILVYEESLRGGFVELGMAYAQSLPIWVLSRPGESISNSVQGCAEKMILYESLDEVSHHLLQAYRQYRPVSVFLTKGYNSISQVARRGHSELRANVTRGEHATFLTSLKWLVVRLHRSVVSYRQ